MWQDLKPSRESGALVLGVYHTRHISDELMRRLSSRLRARFGGSGFERRDPGGPPTVVVWDSHATPERTWRLRPLHKLSSSIAGSGTATIVAAHTSLAGDPTVVENFGNVTLAPMLEIDAAAFEADQAHQSARGRLRLKQVAASTTAHALERLRLGGSDTLVVMAPVPTECLALASALSNASSRGECPAVVVELSPLMTDDSLEPLTSHRSSELKEAIDALADAADDRFTLVTVEAAAAEALRTRLERPVEAIPVHEAGCFLERLQRARGSNREAGVMSVEPTVRMETLYATAE
jgi:hypothetical protein